jgi:hypothetical protein
MNRIVSTLGAASILVLSGVAYGAQPLTTEQMDSVTAGGLATGGATAAAIGQQTFTSTLVQAQTGTIGTSIVDPQFGSFAIVGSSVIAGAESVSGNPPPFGNPAVAASIAGSTGATVGDLISDTQSLVGTSTTSVAPGAAATAGATNTSIAASYTIYSSSASASTAGAAVAR